MRVMVRLAKTGGVVRPSGAAAGTRSRAEGAGGDAPVSAETLSVSENVPKDYVDQILRRLRQAGLIASVRGPAGGYALAKPAASIRVGDVVRAVEQEVFENVCERFADGRQDCHHQGACGLRPVWKKLGSVIEDYLNSVTLEQIMNQEAEPDFVKLLKG